MICCTGKVGLRDRLDTGYTPCMVDNTEKKKAPMATWLIATIAVGLLVLFVIGVAVL